MLNVDLVFINNLYKSNKPYDYLINSHMSSYFYDKIDPSIVPFSEQKNICLSLKYNRLFEALRIKEMQSINLCLMTENIKPIFFKGSILAHKLYGNMSYLRLVGDIDLWVSAFDYNKSLKTLYDNGYILLFEGSDKDGHHAQLKKTNIVVELHKSIIPPRMCIDEKYLYYSVESYEINKVKYWTFTDTATLIHLIYHFYSDLFLSSGFDSIYVNGKLLKLPSKHERMAYEICRFIEIYNDSINWEVLKEEILKQRFDLLFYCLIKYIDDMYKVFPPDFFNVIKEKICKYSKDNILTYDYWKTLKSSTDYVLSEPLVKYLENNWKGKELVFEKNINSFFIDEYSKNKINGKISYIIQGEIPKSSKDLSFRFDYWCDTNFLYFEVDVNDDIIIFSGKVFDSYQCDCLGLIFVKTQPYEFKQIFIFPTKNDNKISCVIRDMNTSDNISPEIIKANILITAFGYKVRIKINKSFFVDNESIYFDLLVCDCDDSNIGKKTTMNVFGDSLKWDDVSKFSKIYF